MKTIIAAFFVIGAAVIFVFGALSFTVPSSSHDQDFLRLHIRANSNSVEDQDVKYLVKQQIVDELTPIFVDVTTKSQAMDMLAENLARIEEVADACLVANGFNYGVRAAIKSEHFPTRVYTVSNDKSAGANNSNNSVTLPEGIYDALIIELGSGTGDNWWCCIYPPLCFLENNIGGEQGVKYRSKLQEWLGK